MVFLFEGWFSFEVREFHDSIMQTSTIATQNFLPRPPEIRDAARAETPHIPGRRTTCYTNPGFCTPGFNCWLRLAGHPAA
jgi:hypothetical protein